MADYKLLYYPTMSIPKQWAKTSILNGYSIGSVVPDNWNENYEEFLLDPTYNRRWVRSIPDEYLSREEMKILKSENIYFPYSSFLQKHILNEIKKDYFEYLDDQELDIQKKSLQFKSLSDDEIKHFTWIEKNIMTKKMIKELIKRNLADPQEHMENGKPHIIVEDFAGSIYKSLFANYLAKKDKLTIVSTDDFSNWELIAKPIYSDPTQLCMNLFLKDSLLMPKENVSIEKLLDFKQDYKNEIKKYQREVSKLSSYNAQYIKPSEYANIIQEQIEQIKTELTILESELKDNKINFFKGCIIKTIPLLVTTSFFNEFSALVALLDFGISFDDYLSTRGDLVDNCPWSIVMQASSKKIINN